MGQDNTLPGTDTLSDGDTLPDDETLPDEGTLPDGGRSRRKALPVRSTLDLITRQRLIIGGIVFGVLVLIGILIWILLGILANHPAAESNPAPLASASRGPLPADIQARDYQQGDCFSDFDSNASQGRVVECNTPHSAQLGAVYRYNADDSFPGADALKEKGREVCRNLVLNEASTNYKLLQQNVYPSSASWDKGDRRVDCFIVVDSGNTLKESVLQQ
ncbi:septum formation family protein [Arthrobacter sp. NyZ413]|uniref:septum formation family protein n=1 Tax=Arthrobacter sp. NyZ413 TaxID=3144669 RepID=UPI003BF79BB8